MATYKLTTKNDIKFICILDREVRKKILTFKSLYNVRAIQ